jgi:predicted 2-oxoglutarate/Fe(II)-dependent dioxygenase YbiX
MEIKNFIKIYDEVLPWASLTNLIRFCSSSPEFIEGRVGGNKNDGSEVKSDIRKVLTLPLSNLHNSLSNVHWFNLLQYFFSMSINKYQHDLKIKENYITNIIDINILKYENNCFYTWHSDHFAGQPRTLSCILLLNNDYEGGDLYFRNPDGSEEWKVDIKPNRLIIWPSNFLYPHTVKPVTKGIRYSVVAWAL